MQNPLSPQSYQHLLASLPNNLGVIDLYLDKAGLFDGEARGVAAVRLAAEPLICTIKGCAEPQRIDLELITSQNAVPYRLSAVREGENLSGELIDTVTGLRNAIVLKVSNAGNEIPSLLKGGPDPVPVSVRYDVSTSGGNFVFKDFTVIPWPMGSWRGSRLWNQDDGLVFLAPDLFDDEMIFRMTSWGLQTVGTLRCRLSQLGNGKNTEIIGDSTLWIDDRWTPVTGRIWQSTSR